MKFNYVIFVSLMGLSILGCATNKTKVTKNKNGTENLKIQQNKEIPSCRVLFNKKSPSQSKINECISTVNKTSIPQFIDRLLKYKPPVPKETLGKLTNILTNDAYIIYTGSLKKLIKAGAPTENVNVPYIWLNNDFACDTVMIILKNNIHLYTNQKALQSKPNGVIPDHTSKKRITDLAWLANTSDGKSICNNAIRFLAKYNPKLLNNKEFTPLDSYLGDRFHPQWNIAIAKILMTKENTNRELSSFFPASAPSSSGTSKWDLILLKEILKSRGRAITLQEKAWLRNKQPDLLSKLEN